MMRMVSGLFCLMKRAPLNVAWITFLICSDLNRRVISLNCLRGRDPELTLDDADGLGPFLLDEARPPKRCLDNLLDLLPVRCEPAEATAIPDIGRSMISPKW